MSTRVQIVFDCADPARISDFWTEALHYQMEAPPQPFASWDDWARSMGIPEDRWNDVRALVDPDGVGPRLFFQRVPEDKVAKNRVHLDLSVSGDRGTPPEERRPRIDAEVARLKALGASDARGPMAQNGEYWVRMNDPEGNEFCVQ